MSDPYVPLQEANDYDKYKVCTITLLEPMLTITHSNEPSLLFNLIEMCLSLMWLFRKQMMVTIILADAETQHTHICAEFCAFSPLDPALKFS